MDIREIFIPKLTIKRAIEIYNNLKAHPELTPISRPHGKFMYEFLPTIALASKIHAQYFTVTEDTKFPYDAVLYFYNNTEIFVEWVSAIPHHEAKIKLTKLKEDGKASVNDRPSLESVKKTPASDMKTQSSGTIETFCKESLTDLIIESFKKKNDKLERAHYNSNMILGIVYDNAGLDHEMASQALEEAKQVICSTKSFDKIYFISLREAYKIVGFNLN